MNFFAIIIIVFLVILAVKLAQMKIHIKFKSFFRRGFKKKDNKFGLVAYVRKTRQGKDLFRVSVSN